MPVLRLATSCKQEQCSPLSGICKPGPRPLLQTGLAHVWPESQRDACLGSVTAGGWPPAQEGDRQERLVLGILPVPLGVPVPFSLLTFPLPSQVEGAQPGVQAAPRSGRQLGLPGPAPTMLSCQLSQSSSQC